LARIVVFVSSSTSRETYIHVFSRTRPNRIQLAYTYVLIIIHTYSEDYIIYRTMMHQGRRRRILSPVSLTRLMIIIIILLVSRKQLNTRWRVSRRSHLACAYVQYVYVYTYRTIAVIRYRLENFGGRSLSLNTFVRASIYRIYVFKHSHTHTYHYNPVGHETPVFPEKVPVSETVRRCVCARIRFGFLRARQNAYTTIVIIAFSRSGERDRDIFRMVYPCA